MKIDRARTSHGRYPVEPAHVRSGLEGLVEQAEQPPAEALERRQVRIEMVEALRPAPRDRSDVRSHSAKVAGLRSDRARVSTMCR